MQNSDGIIIILAYPDTVVRPAYWEPSSKIWPKIGIGSKHAVQAGHAALLLIKKNQPTINYFDFGRYITSYGNGRVRCKETDPELTITITAQFKNNVLINLSEILLWIEKHPEKTHGDGRLVASLHEDINFKKAQQYIYNLVDKKEISYGVFIKKGSNCARFVTDTIINTSNHKNIVKKLKKSNLLTPSPIGNVIKGTTSNRIYTVYQQKITLYKNSSILKEYKASFFKKFDYEPNLLGTEKPNSEVFELKNGTWLGGIGSGAWFVIEKKITEKQYKISRFNHKGIKDFTGVFKTKTTDFKIEEKHFFIHPSNCNEVFIKQHNCTFLFYNKDIILPPLF